MEKESRLLRLQIDRHCSFWFVNKTLLPLVERCGSDVTVASSSRSQVGEHDLILLRVSCSTCVEVGSRYDWRCSNDVCLVRPELITAVNDGPYTWVTSLTFGWKKNSASCCFSKCNFTPNQHSFLTFKPSNITVHSKKSESWSRIPHLRMFRQWSQMEVEQLLLPVGTHPGRRHQIPPGYLPSGAGCPGDDATARAPRGGTSRKVRCSCPMARADRAHQWPGQLCLFLGLLYCRWEKPLSFILTLIPLFCRLLLMSAVCWSWAFPVSHWVKRRYRHILTWVTLWKVAWYLGLFILTEWSLWSVLDL